MCGGGGGKGGKGIISEKLGGGVHSLLKTLTLFRTNITIFSSCTVENTLPDTKFPVAEKTNSTLHSSGNLLSVG